MFKIAWQRILALFNKNSQTTDKERQDNEKYAVEYEKINDVNITAMFSNRLANYVTDESVIELEKDNKRAESLNNTLQLVLKDKKKITSRVLGTGGIVLVPFVSNGLLQHNKIAQNRLSINKMIGNKIVDATITADTKIIKTALSTTTYHRLTDYRIENGNCIIEQCYTNEQGETIPKPHFWADINDLMVIPGVDRVLFSYIKSPVDNRVTSDLYGVPITYGCDRTIKRILHTLSQIEREYDLKEVFVGVDTTMFNEGNTLPASGIWKRIDSGENHFFEVFDPAIRDSAYFNKLQQQFALLEKEVGTSRGILTDPIATYQNVDESRRALRDTLSIINDMREALIEGIEDFLYACDILSNYYNLTPQGEYELKVTWGYGLAESYTETINQYRIGFKDNVVSATEYRNVLMDKESIEESEAKIKEIEAKNPSTKDLLGGKDD